MLALFGKRLQPRNDRHQNLHHDRCRDVRVDAECSDAELSQRVAAEDVEEAEDRVAFERAGQGILVDVRKRDVGQQTKHHKHREREEKFLSHVWLPKCVDAGL